ncbi:Endonuclease/exonuclease/phosphatase [Gautieria morchelliformis]|nr:Endonuclease/exonuclease/phosphatase [Gautieria morchelliformis]
MEYREQRFLSTRRSLLPGQNGIRTLPQYHPWNTLKTGEAILNELNADIICFQEMKIQRMALQKHMAVPNGYDSFFSFPVAKGGYSGVAVYTKSDIVAPLKAEEGLTGNIQPKPPFKEQERVSPTYPQAHQIEFYHDENGDTPSSLTSLDAEGRALVLDFGLFVLVNLYCPAEISDTRLPYKMNFHLLLEERVRKLIHEEGREVIIVGDINVTAAPIDHCDGELPSQQADFWSRPPRAWLKNWLVPLGPMVDVVRDAWPERKGMYTCWNTKIAARDSNYGTRLDYILLTRGLIPWFKHGDIQASIRGSDHCPVYVDLHDEIQLDSGTTLTLRDAMKFEQAKRKSPRISAAYWDEFKQRLLSNFFTAKVLEDVPTPSTSSGSLQETVPIEPISQVPVAKVLSSQATQREELTLVESRNSSQGSPCAAETSTFPSRKCAPSFSKTKRNGDDLTNEQRKKRKVGQTKISSFFAKPPVKSSSSEPNAPRSSSTPADIDAKEVDAGTQRQTQEPAQMNADHELAISLSEAADTTEVQASTSSSQSKAAWKHLLTPLRPPLCRTHREPCKEFTVNKAGPNKGKAFFICSRPLGPGYDKGRTDRLREEVDMQYRCNFFKWASEVKTEALKDGAKGNSNGGNSDGAISSGSDTTKVRIPP